MHKESSVSTGAIRAETTPAPLLPRPPARSPAPAWGFCCCFAAGSVKQHARDITHGPGKVRHNSLLWPQSRAARQRAVLGGGKRETPPKPPKSRSAMLPEGTTPGPRGSGCSHLFHPIPQPQERPGCPGGRSLCAQPARDPQGVREIRLGFTAGPGEATEPLRRQPRSPPRRRGPWLPAGPHSNPSPPPARGAGRPRPPPAQGRGPAATQPPTPAPPQRHRTAAPPGGPGAGWGGTGSGVATEPPAVPADVGDITAALFVQEARPAVGRLHPVLPGGTPVLPQERHGGGTERDQTREGDEERRRNPDAVTRWVPVRRSCRRGAAPRYLCGGGRRVAGSAALAPPPPRRTWQCLSAPPRPPQAARGGAGPRLGAGPGGGGGARELLVRAAVKPGSEVCACVYAQIAYIYIHIYM